MTEKEQIQKQLDDMKAKFEQDKNAWIRIQTDSMLSLCEDSMVMGALAAQLEMMDGVPGEEKSDPKVVN